MTIWTNISTFLGRIFTFDQAKFDALIADIKQGVEVAESDLAMAAAWVTTNGPSLVSEAQTLLSVLSALTGNLTIPAPVISALTVAINDVQQFVTAVTAANSAGSAAGAFDALAATHRLWSPAAMRLTARSRRRSPRRVSRSPTLRRRRLEP
jgi:hypothetical protein